MLEPKLTKRLQTAASLVREGAAVADVGCDHGKLAASLLLSGRASRVVATDVNPGPLAKAQQLFAQLGVTARAKALLADGLNGVDPTEADDVVIAGLGADTIIGIVARAEWLQNSGKRLILVPAARHARLRGWLYQNGFALVKETAVLDMGKRYTVMLAQYTGESERKSAVFCALGQIRPGDSADAMAYVRWVLEKNKKILSGARLASAQVDAQKLRDAQAVVQYIEELLA